MGWYISPFASQVRQVRLSVHCFWISRFVLIFSTNWIASSLGERLSRVIARLIIEGDWRLPLKSSSPVVNEHSGFRFPVLDKLGSRSVSGSRASELYSVWSALTWWMRPGRSGVEFWASLPWEGQRALRWIRSAIALTVSSSIGTFGWYSQDSTDQYSLPQTLGYKPESSARQPDDYLHRSEVPFVIRSAPNLFPINTLSPNPLWWLLESSNSFVTHAVKVACVKVIPRSIAVNERYFQHLWWSA